MQSRYSVLLTNVSFAAMWMFAAAQSVAQVSGVPTPSTSMPATILPDGASRPIMPSTGNPFLNRNHPRPTLLTPRVDDRVVRASFEQPIGGSPAAEMQFASSGSNSNAITAPMTEVRIPETADAVVNAEVAAPAAVAPVAPPQALSGIALLTQRPIDPQSANFEHPLAPVIRWADDALQQMQGLRDYSGTFTKREWIDGRLLDQQVLYAKVRHQPYSVYLQFLAPNDVRGQEALYVAGRNGGNLLAHPVGIKQALVGTISIAPDSPTAMEGNRHPITDFGVRRLLERYREGSALDSNYGECEVQIIENAKVNSRPCVCIEVVHPVPRKEFRFYRCRLFVDQEWNIPVRYECYNWATRPGEQPQLVEEYTYQGLRLNAGLSDADFDQNNPQYRFN